MLKIKYETERLHLLPSNPSMADHIYNYSIRNKKFLEKFEPLREDTYFTKENIINQIYKEMEEAKELKGVRFWIFKKEETSLIGSVALSNIVKGAFLSCFLGYKLDEKELNKGYMTEAVGKAVEIAFDDMGLHRVEANVMPKNIASIKVLEKSGFIQEGLSKKYLKINGNWEDHVRMAILNDSM